MTEHERQLRRRDRIRLGAVLALVLIGVVPVVVALAASPEPPAGGATATARVQPRIDAPGGFGGGFGRGFGGAGAISVTAVDGAKLALKTDDGWTRTITITPDTTVTKAGQTVASSAIAVGDRIRFAQKRNDDGTYTVTRIAIVVDRTAGEVTSIAGDTLTIKRRNGETQVITLTGSTTYHLGRADGARADVTVGSRVEIAGDAAGSGFTALSVTVRPTTVGGEVTARTTDTLTLKRRDGTSVTVHLAPTTTFGIRGDKTATGADIKVGDRVWASGRSRADGSLDATAVVKGFGFGGHGDDHRGDGAKPAPSASSGGG